MSSIHIRLSSKKVPLHRKSGGLFVEKCYRANIAKYSISFGKTISCIVRRGIFIICHIYHAIAADKASQVIWYNTFRWLTSVNTNSCIRAFTDICIQLWPTFWIEKEIFPIRISPLEQRNKCNFEMNECTVR